MTNYAYSGGISEPLESFDSTEIRGNFCGVDMGMVLIGPNNNHTPRCTHTHTHTSLILNI